MRTSSAFVPTQETKGAYSELAPYIPSKPDQVHKPTSAKSGDPKVHLALSCYQVAPVSMAAILTAGLRNSERAMLIRETYYLWFILNSDARTGNQNSGKIMNEDEGWENRGDNERLRQGDRDISCFNIFSMDGRTSAITRALKWPSHLRTFSSIVFHAARFSLLDANAKRWKCNGTRL